MLKNKKISLVIPAKNEEKALAQMLKQVPACVDEIIVVDNGSTDNTATVAKKFGAKVITEERKDKYGIGYGYAHMTGIKAAKGDCIVTMDADGTYPLKEVKKAVSYLEKNNLDFVSCNRFPLKNGQAISIVRKFGVWILNLQVRTLYGYSVKDILSGMWVMKRETKTKLRLKEGGWDFSPEIKLEAIKNDRVAFGEFHIDHKYRVGDSKQRIFQTGLNHFVYLFERKLSEVQKIVYTGAARVAPRYLS